MRHLSIVWLFIAVGLSTGSWASRIASLPGALHLSHQALGLVLFAKALGAFVAFAWSPTLLARVQQRRLTLVAIAGLCAAMPVAGLTLNVWSTTLALFAMGLSSGLVNISMNVYAVSFEKRERVPMLASCHGLCSAGALAGAAGGQLAAHMQMGLWAHLGWVAAVMAVGTAGIAYVLVSLDKAEAAVRPTRLIAPDAARKAKAAPATSLVRLSILVACGAMCEGSLHAWSTVYLHQDLGMSQAGAAQGFVCFALAMVLSRLSAERLAWRMGARALVTAGSVAVACGVVLMLVVTSPQMALLGIAMAGFGIGGAVPLAFREASKRRADAPQEALARMTQCMYAGGLLAPPLIGMLAERCSLRLALLSLAVMAMAVGWASQTLGDAQAMATDADNVLAARQQRAS